MKKNTNFEAPIIEFISISGDKAPSVICTSFNEIVALTDDLDSDSLDW